MTHITVSHQKQDALKELNKLKLRHNILKPLRMHKRDDNMLEIRVQISKRESSLHNFRIKNFQKREIFF